MKANELLEAAMKTGDMIVTDEPYYTNQAIVYCKELFTFVWCDRHTGEYEKNDSNECGYNRVILCSQIFTDGWYLEPISKLEPISINGTNFTDYDKAIQYINVLKRRRNALRLYEKVCRETGTKPIILADKETIEFINNELNK